MKRSKFILSLMAVTLFLIAATLGLGFRSQSSDETGLTFLFIVITGGVIIFGGLLATALFTASGGAENKNTQSTQQKPLQESLSAFVLALIIAATGVYLEIIHFGSFIFNLAMLTFLLGILRLYLYMQLRRAGSNYLTTDKGQSTIATTLVLVFILLIFI